MPLLTCATTRFLGNLRLAKSKKKSINLARKNKRRRLNRNDTVLHSIAYGGTLGTSLFTSVCGQCHNLQSTVLIFHSSPLLRLHTYQRSTSTMISYQLKRTMLSPGQRDAQQALRTEIRQRRSSNVFSPRIASSFSRRLIKSLPQARLDPGDFSPSQTDTSFAKLQVRPSSNGGSMVLGSSQAILQRKAPLTHHRPSRRKKS